MKHFTDRQPQGRNTAWRRKVTMDGGLLTYTLFRRGENNRLHEAHLQYTPLAPRRMIAGDIVRARKLLRDRVDEIDLARMEAA